MSFANWLTVSPATGSGNQTVGVTGSTYTGRVMRQTVIEVTAANVTPAQVTIKQKGATEFASPNANSYTKEKEGGTLTVEGKSNSSGLTFSLGTGDLNISLPSNYTANGETTANGAAIAGDPGASAEYNWSIQFSIPSATTIETLSRQLIITDGAGHTAVVTINLTGVDAYLTVSVQELTLEADGTPSSFDITSNTSWTIDGASA